MKILGSQVTPLVYLLVYNVFAQSSLALIIILSLFSSLSLSVSPSLCYPLSPSLFLISPIASLTLFFFISASRWVHVYVFLEERYYCRVRGDRSNSVIQRTSVYLTPFGQSSPPLITGSLISFLYLSPPLTLSLVMHRSRTNTYTHKMCVSVCACVFHRRDTHVPAVFTLPPVGVRRSRTRMWPAY